jgi:CheY-like chemotaxis protein
VKQHGGYIGARSTPGQGATIEVYWPTAGTPAARGGDALPQQSSARGRGRVVLVADDEPLVRALVVRALEEEGYVVHAAADGEAALRTIEQGAVTPDIVVTDVIMPRRNGRQLHDAVRKRWPGLPVLFISGHTGDEAVLQRLVPRGAPFLQKPFSPDALARTVAELVRR